jgi:hypothetical protein
MSAAPIPDNFLAAFGNVSSQGDLFNNRISEDGWYYAFLSKLDPHYGDDLGSGSPDGLTATFEIAPRAYIENAVLRTDTAMRTLPRNIPGSLLHFENVIETDLRKLLKLTAEDPLAEGEWYLLKLEGGTGKGLGAVMIDPDLDLKSNGPS